MERELRDELEVPGHVVMIQTKSVKEWCEQARKALDKAKTYGANTPNQMNSEDKASLREALKALGQEVDF